MPSIQAPTHYERTSGILPNEYDPFLKFIGPNDLASTEHETGDTEQPLGHVMLIHLDAATRDYIVRDYIDAISGEVPIPDLGWYIIRADDNGLVWGMTYGEDCVYNEERARADYEEAYKVAAAWWRAEDQVTEDDDEDVL